MGDRAMGRVRFGLGPDLCEHGAGSRGRDDVAFLVKETDGLVERGRGLRWPAVAFEDLSEIEQRVAAEVQKVGTAGKLDRFAGESFGLVQAADRAERERSRSLASRADVDA